MCHLPSSLPGLQRCSPSACCADRAEGVIMHVCLFMAMRLAWLVTLEGQRHLMKPMRGSVSVPLRATKLGKEWDMWTRMSAQLQ